MPALRSAVMRFDASPPLPAELRRRLRLQLVEQLCSRMCAAVALHAQIAREGPHRRRRLEHVDVDMRPERLVLGLHVAREPRHVDIDQQADVGLRQMLVGREAEEARAVVRDIDGHVAFEHRDAGELGQLRRSASEARAIASGIAGDQDRILGRDAAGRRAARSARDRRRRRCVLPYCSAEKRRTSSALQCCVSVSRCIIR